MDEPAVIPGRAGGERQRRALPGAALTLVWLAVTTGTFAGEAWNLSDLPSYQPEQEVSGTIRNFGSDLWGTVNLWEKAFCARQPGITFSDRFPGSDAAIIGGLVSGAADLAPNGREPMLIEYLAFSEAFGHDLADVTVATGAADLKGRSWSIVIYVHRDNPLTHLTLKQLDGIFGAERTGGYRGYVWRPEAGRGAAENVRTWGQLGLTGEWADKPIHTYGYAFTGMTNFFQLKVLQGGDKWNPNYREYVEGGTKMVEPGEVGATGDVQHMLMTEFAADRYGIAWTGLPHAAGMAHLKALALAETAGGPFVQPTRRSVQDRTYPLARSVFIQFNHTPGRPLAPRLREFLQFILSREGQQAVVENGNYLPLTATAVREQRAKLDDMR